MTSTIPLKFINSASQVTVHSIPCKIHANDKANVSTYFKLEENEGYLTSSFRGYPLDGRVVPLPAECKGLVVDVDDESSYKCTGSFQKLTHWNWNKAPSKSDTICTAIEWINLAKAIHDPISNNESAPS